MRAYPPPTFEHKICGRDQLMACLAVLPRPLVFTNGCFDILHRGHVTYLAQARALGASLLVGVNSDASVKGLGKGDERPINNEAEVLVKGGDWSAETIVGGQEVLSWNGVVHAIPFLHQRSTTATLTKIRG